MVSMKSSKGIFLYACLRQFSIVASGKLCVCERDVVLSNHTDVYQTHPILDIQLWLAWQGKDQLGICMTGREASHIVLEQMKQVSDLSNSHDNGSYLWKFYNVRNDQIHNLRGSSFSVLRCCHFLSNITETRVNSAFVVDYFYYYCGRSTFASEQGM